MATFVPYRNNLDSYDNQTFTEPCMSCFASVTYNRKEAQDDPRVTGGKCIVCPSCGRLMRVNFANISLC